MIIIRSFDVNKPGAGIEELNGGVAGGSILTGVLKLDDEIEIRPGIVTRDENGKVQCRPIFSKVVSLYAERNDLKFAVPGGLIGVGTRIDPTLCRADRLLGFVLGLLASSLPSTPNSKSTTSCCVVCSVSSPSTASASYKVAKLSKNEVLMVDVGLHRPPVPRSLVSRLMLAKLVLTNPACTEIGEKIAISRRIREALAFDWLGQYCCVSFPSLCYSDILVLSY